MKVRLMLLWCFLSLASSLYASSSFTEIICSGESIFRAGRYYGYLQSIERFEDRMMVTFEKYEAQKQADTTNPKCRFYSAYCKTCEIEKRDWNTVVYRPANASSTVLCGAGSSITEYRSLSSFIKGVHKFEVYPALSVNGSAVLDSNSISDVSCVSWEEQ